MNALTGVRVIEITTAWSGPFVGRFLGAFGAEVVKVESARAVDIWRGPVPLSLGTRHLEGREPEQQSVDASPNFNALNRNKRGIALDLATERGRELFLGIVADVDLVVANLTERVLVNLRLGYEELCCANPQIILLNMPALGASGPYRGAAGYGSIMEGMGGMAARFGYRHEQARVSATFYPDPVAGIHATVAVLAALRRRDRTGAGCLIDLSQQETLWMQHAEGLVLRSLENREPDRLGNAEPGCVPSGVYPTSDDRWVAIVVKGDEELRRLVRAADGRLDRLVDLHSDRDLVTVRDRADELVAAWTGELEAASLLDRLHAHGVRTRVVSTFATAVSDDAVRPLLEELDHPVCGHQGYLRVPLRIDGQLPASRRHAPPFDHDTDEVLQAWCRLDSDEITDLRGAGVIGGVPAVLHSGQDEG